VQVDHASNHAFIPSRQSQPVPTPVTYHVTTQIFITRDLLGAIGPIDRAVVPGHR